MLEFIGIIALLLICKFVYDSYLTNNTDKNFEAYKEKNPERAARIERNNGLNLSTEPKSRSKDKVDSLLRMAQNMRCSPDEVKGGFILDLEKEKIDKAKFSTMIQIIKEQKYEESKIFNIDPDDTAAAYMEQWTIEHYEGIKTSFLIRDSHTKEKQIDNEEAFLLNGRGEEKFSEGLYEEAIQLFSSAIHLQQHEIFYCNRANSHNELGQIKNAKQDYYEVIKLKPEENFGNVWYKLATIYADEEDFENSLICLNKTILLSPEKKIALFNRAKINIKIGDTGSAIDDLERLIELLPNLVDAYIILANVYLDDKNLSETKRILDTIDLRELTRQKFLINETQALQVMYIRHKYYDSLKEIDD